MSQANQRRIVAETRQSVHVHYRQCQTAYAKWVRRKAPYIGHENTHIHIYSDFERRVEYNKPLFKFLTN